MTSTLKKGLIVMPMLSRGAQSFLALLVLYLIISFSHRSTLMAMVLIFFARFSKLFSCNFWLSLCFLVWFVWDCD